MGSLIPQHQNHDKYRKSQGFLLLEVVISLAIFGLLLMFFTMSFSNFFSVQGNSWKRVEATLYAQEGMEVMYNLANNTSEWDEFVENFDFNEVYHPVFSPQPQLAVGPETLDDQFTRKIYVNTVLRDPITYQIRPSGTAGAVEDRGTLHIITEVTWTTNQTPQIVRYETYLIERED